MKDSKKKNSIVWLKVTVYVGNTDIMVCFL